MSQAYSSQGTDDTKHEKQDQRMTARSKDFVRFSVETDTLRHPWMDSRQ